MQGDDPDRPVQETPEAVLGAPGRADFEPEQYIPEDPNKGHRRFVGTVASGLMVASIVFARAVVGYPAGGHSTILNTSYGPPEAILAAVGLGAAWAVYNPMRPDPRVAQAIMLAAGMVSIVLGVTVFLTATLGTPSEGIQQVWPGPQPWALIVSGILFLYLRWRRDLWPESPWEERIRSAAMRRAR